MTYYIDRISAVTISGSPERKTVQIGEQFARPRPTTPLRNLPHRLDAAACLAIIERIDPDASADKITAGAQKIDVEYIDNLLEFTELDTLGKMTLKAALSEFGLLPRGRRYS